MLAIMPLCWHLYEYIDIDLISARAKSFLTQNEHIHLNPQIYNQNLLMMICSTLNAALMMNV